MKTHKLLLISIILLTSFFSLNAQVDTTSTIKKMYVITKNDGVKFIGEIISQDAREVLIKTSTIGDVIIPKHEIKSIEELVAGDIDNKGNYLGKTIFASRYFITTNALSIEKGESYVQWNLWGPDFEFGVGKNFGMGIMSTWFGIPIIGTAKYTFQLDQGVSMGIGTIVGTGSWVAPDYGVALPYAVLTIGDRRNNINFSGGYGALLIEGDFEGRALFSVAGMTKLSPKISLVFDSFLAPTFSNNQEDFAILIPGLRWQIENKNAFQFGFAGLYFDGEFIPVPIPMVQWYRKIN
jgi:hypothetical protein